MNNIIYNTSVDVVGSGINSFLLKSFWEDSFTYDLATIVELIASYENTLKLIISRREELVTLIKIGILCTHINEYEKAEKYLLQALLMDINNPESHLHYAFSLLSQGKLHDGFREFEYRFHLNIEQIKIFTSLGLDKRYKEGINLSGKTLLILPEHGFGETFQFIRFIRNLKVLYNEITLILAIQTELLDLFSRHPIFGLDLLVSSYDIIGLEFDYYIPLLSLPILIGVRDIESIRISKCDYIDYSALSSKKIRMNKKQKIGIAWSGYKERNNNASRSLSRDNLIYLVESLKEEFDIYSIQHSNAEYIDSFDNNVIKLIGEKSTFLDTLEAINSLDIVISVCTSTLHLSGTLGVKTYGLISRNGNWRWFDPNDQELNITSPWYPSVKLIRQSALGCWESAINKLILELKESLTNTSTSLELLCIQ